MITLTIGAVVTSILVVVSTSTVYSVLWLVCTFILVSFLLALYGLTFPALLYVIVYIGAIAILFLFVIQLLDLSSISESNEVGNKGLLNIRFITMQPFLLFTILFVVISILITQNYEQNYDLFTKSENLVNLVDQISYGNYITNSYYNMTGLLNNTIYSNSGLMSIANSLYGIAILPLIIISLILLIAMIAPIYLCL